MYLWLLNTHPNNLYNAVKKNNNRGYTHTTINAPKHVLSFYHFVLIYPGLIKNRMIKHI